MTVNPVVFMDISIADKPVGRLTFELFSNIVPKTSENFRQLCTGEHRKHNVPTGYKNCKFHRVIEEFMVQGGDYIMGNGSGQDCIYGSTFDDENFNLKHDQPGLLSMANSGPNTNGCQFFITCKACPWLDAKHVVFGKLVDGWKTLRMMENTPVGPQSKPKLDITITECGEM